MIKFLHREMTVVWCMKKLTGLCSDVPRDCILSLCVKREQITFYELLFIQLLKRNCLLINIYFESKQKYFTVYWWTSLGVDVCTRLTGGNRLIFNHLALRMSGGFECVLVERSRKWNYGLVFHGQLLRRRFKSMSKVVAGVIIDV